MQLTLLQEVDSELNAELSEEDASQADASQEDAIASQNRKATKKAESNANLDNDHLKNLFYSHRIWCKEF